MRQLLTRHRWLVGIVLLAFVVRLYNFSNPIADWHSWRQVDTASVTREYVKHGIDFLHPRYHDLSDVPSGKKNPEGYRMVEFPLINAAVAWLVINLGLPLVQTSRFVSIVFSLGTLLSLYFLVKKLSGEKTALATAAVFGLMPFSVYYGRVILPEPGVLFFSTFSLTTFLYWLDSYKAKWYVLSLAALAIGFLLKPFVLFLAPVYGILVLLYFQKRWHFLPLLVLYAGLSLLPFYWWREHIAQFPEGIPASSWLFNSNLIRLRPAWFRWLGWERIGKLFLGVAGLSFLPFNLLKPKKDTLVYGAWWVGMVAYMVVIATGNVQHDYYQNLLIPIVSISVGAGALKMFEWLRAKLPGRWALGIVITLLMISWYIAWLPIKGFFQINHWEYIEAGLAVDQLTPQDAKVIAPVFGNTILLYQTNRIGWPIGFSIEEKRSLGAEFYITTSKDDEANELRARYPVLKETDRYLLLDLRQPLASESATPL